MSPVHDNNTGSLVEPTTGSSDRENATEKEIQYLKKLISDAVARQEAFVKRVEELENQLRVLDASTNRTIIPRYLEHSSLIRSLEQRVGRAEQNHLASEVRITELECVSANAVYSQVVVRVLLCSWLRFAEPNIEVSTGSGPSPTSPER